MSIGRPIVMDFINSPGFFDPRVSYSRAAGTGFATRVDGNGNMVRVLPNEPRFDYSSVTGELEGLFIEEGSTNLNYNPANEGTGGTALTSGNMPSAQSASGIANGLTVTRLTDVTLRGMVGAVYRFGGTASNLTIPLLTLQSPDISASSGQVYSSSVYLALLRGSMATASIAQQQLTTIGGSVTNTTDLLAQLVLGNDPVRSKIEGLVVDVGATGVRPRLRFNFGIGVSPDFDLWVGPHQTELKAWCTSQIMNPAGVVNSTNSRAASQILALLENLNLTGLASEGSAVVYFRTAKGTSANRHTIMHINDGSNSNVVQLFRETDGQQRVTVTSGGTVQTNVLGPTSALDTRYTVALAWGGGAYSASFNGGAVLEQQGISLPAALSALTIGTRENYSDSLNGHIRKILVFPRKLPNATLQLLSA